MRYCPYCGTALEDDDVVKEQGTWWHVGCWEDACKDKREDERLDDPRHGELNRK